jgi:hypothetical protein
MCQQCYDKPEVDKEREYDSEWADTVMPKDTIVLKGGRNADGSYRIVYRGQTRTSVLHPSKDGYVFVRWIYPEH